MAEAQSSFFQAHIGSDSTLIPQPPIVTEGGFGFRVIVLSLQSPSRGKYYREFCCTICRKAGGHFKGSMEDLESAPGCPP
jgi:hypothetical protein